MILLGNDFWNTLNGMHDAKMNEASDYDVFADLEESCSAIFQNKLIRHGIEKSEEEIKNLISSYEANIPGTIGDPNYSLTRKTGRLKEVAVGTLEGDDMAIFNINSRKPSQSKGLRKVA